MRLVNTKMICLLAFELRHEQHSAAMNTRRYEHVQFRVAFGKKDEVVHGPDDADVVISVAAGDAHLDPTSLYMQGKLKAQGSTGALFALLQSGEVSAVIQRLASRP